MASILGDVWNAITSPFKEQLQTAEGGPPAKFSPVGIASGKKPAAPTSAPATSAPSGTSSPSLSFQQLISPLALQSYYAQTIGPMLAQIAQQQQGMVGTYDKTMHDALNRPMPAEAKDVLSAMIPQTEANMNQQINAQQGAALSAPALDQLTNLLGSALGSQQTLQAEISRALAQQLISGGTPNAGNIFGQLPNSAQAGIPSNTAGVPTSADIARILGIQGTAQPGG